MSDFIWPQQRSFVKSFDGFRGIAVLMVLWYHVYDTMFPANLGVFSTVASVGWVGVDLFFALSGFLITGILLRTRGREKYFHNFYVRRLLRIFPLYYGVVTLVLVSHAIAGRDGGVPAWSLYAYVSNFFVSTAGSPDLSLAITWSLSVEEQFYAVWPAAVAFLSIRNLRLACVAIALASPGVRYMMFDPTNHGAFMNTFCRMDALTIGALGAIAWYENVEWMARAAWKAAWPAAALLVGMMFVANTGVASHHAAVVACSYSVVAVCTTTILLALATGGMQSASTVLNFKPLAYVGKVSFGVYLLHPLVFSLTLGVWNMVGLGSPASSVTHAVAMYAVLTVAPVAVASVVFNHIEMPLLAMKDRFAPYKRAATATSTNRPPLHAPQPANASVPAKSADLVAAK